MKLISVCRKTKCLTFKSGYNRMILHGNRIVMKIGYFTPVEIKKAYKIYYAITKE